MLSRFFTQLIFCEVKIYIKNFQLFFSYLFYGSFSGRSRGISFLSLALFLALSDYLGTSDSV